MYFSLSRLELLFNSHPPAIAKKARSAQCECRSVSTYQDTRQEEKRPPRRAVAVCTIKRIAGQYGGAAAAGFLLLLFDLRLVTNYHTLSSHH